MEQHTVQLVAGTISSFFFISSNLPMLLKAYKSRDLSSYSLSYLILNIIGDLVYWLYISSLPIGPIWVMHAFYTVTSALMLAAFLRYEARSNPRVRLQESNSRAILLS